MRKCYFITLKCCFLSLLMACESDEKKMTRLSQDQAVACLVVDKYRDDYLAAKSAKSPHADTLGKQWLERQTECDLATRELNRFMR